MDNSNKNRFIYETILVLPCGIMTLALFISFLFLTASSTAIAAVFSLSFFRLNFSDMKSGCWTVTSTMKRK